MAPATAGEAAVDRLYQLPLDEFVAARDGLARQARGEEGRRVRALPKPNIVAWALNQVYWSARPVFEQLLEAAGRLRQAQAETLRGRRADLRSADAAHRDALGTALAESTRVLQAAGHSVTPDTLRSLTAAFEALPWSDPAGRLARPPVPTGFAAFAGMPLDAGPQPAPPPASTPGPAASRGKRRPERGKPLGDKTDTAATREAEARRELEEGQRRLREAAADAREAAVAAAERLRTASSSVAQAREVEQAARLRLEEARGRLREAESDHQAARREAASADARAREAEAAASRPPRHTRPGR